MNCFNRDGGVFFVSGELFQHTTGGILCDRMVADELKKTRTVCFVVPQIRSLLKLNRPLLAGLINNLLNLFRSFPRNSLLFIDHGVYRDCFLAGNLWRWRFRCRVVGLVYHLDYELPEMRGGKTLRAGIEKLMIRAYDYALTISQSTAHHLQQLGQPADRIAQIPVSRRFEPQEYHERPAKSENDPLTFLFVGSVQPRKGLLEAVEALGRYHGRQPVRFQCVGNYDPESAYFHELTETAKRFVHLSFETPGTVSQERLIECFRAADAFLFPSHWEGYGIAIEEAMCFALPVVAYHAGAVPELVEDGVNGWLAPVADIAALARAIAECIEQPDERIRRGRNALAKAHEKCAAGDLNVILENAIATATK